MTYVPGASDEVFKGPTPAPEAVNKAMPCASITVTVAFRLLRSALPQLGVPRSCSVKGPAVTVVRVKYSMSVACLQQQQQQQQQQQRRNSK
jgi:hypothetical protein